MKIQTDDSHSHVIHTKKGSYCIPKDAVKSPKETHAAFIRRVGTKTLDLVTPTNNY